jgi:hypothetical protein
MRAADAPDPYAQTARPRSTAPALWIPAQPSWISSTDVGAFRPASRRAGTLESVRFVVDTCGAVELDLVSRLDVLDAVWPASEQLDVLGASDDCEDCDDCEPTRRSGRRATTLEKLDLGQSQDLRRLALYRVRVPRCSKSSL